ncbi:hypothetical protein TL16_g08681 [Triparma laevis f. inornata]|uniref:sn-1-specific diacylglycerol lipase n=2 Tax=Triparma laevis TaxID=1534972 RepID=A0A9W7F140_9STRA|nr:hypothetical protein TL16_g08681 [Triparma laevis f. inornata]GMH99784.1 hypothetical protein TrLO_g9599 [Triparma laevis f. longispina]
MPSLKTLNRRWLVGGDELQVISLVLIPVRVIQVLLTFMGSANGTCFDAVGTLWLAVTVVYYCVCVLLDLVTVYAASIGTPTSPRQLIPSIVRFKTVFMTPIIVVLCVMSVYCCTFHCGGNIVYRLMIPLVSLSQLGEVIATSCCLYTLRGRRLDDPHLGTLGQRRRLGTEYLESKWEKRCRFLCKCSGFFTCFLFGGNDSGEGNDFAMVARVLADYFEDDGSLDIVPSDVVAGMVCLRHVQKSKERTFREDRMVSAEARQNDRIISQQVSAVQKQAFEDMGVGGEGEGDEEKGPTPRTDLFEKNKTYWHRIADRNVLDPSNQEEREVLEEAARFSKHALSIYTWMLYVFMHPISGVPKLCGANLEESELAYAHFGNSIVENPYCIIIDHKWKSIVLSIRGTLSLEDCITDALTESVPLDDCGRKWGFDGAGEYAHTGILNSSEWIRNDLVKHRTLEKLMKDINAPHPDYRLRVTGHSLGAGCATFLALMLKREYPDLRCLPYSPPGGLVTMKTAKAVAPFTTSFVLNSDIVPRLSLQTMEKLRNDVLDLISRIKVSKMDVLKSAVLGPGGSDRLYIIDDILHPRDAVPDSEFKEQVKRFKDVQRKVKEERGAPDVSLYPPGRIVHFVKTEEAKAYCGGCGKFCGGRDREYTPTWAQNDEFTEIQISPSMAFDHFPDRVCLSIEGVARSWDLDVEPGSLRAVGWGVGNQIGSDSAAYSDSDKGSESPTVDDALLNRV